jgi:hypothetical protein
MTSLVTSGSTWRGPASKCHFLRDTGKGGKTGETGEEFDFFNNSILTGLAGLADRTRCHLERQNRWHERQTSQLTHYAPVGPIAAHALLPLTLTSL